MGARAAVMARLAAVALAGAHVGLAVVNDAMARDGDGLQTCLAITPDEARLACYDREVRKLAPPLFAGRLNRTTDPFRIDQPTVLRFQSDGAIFVLYLKSADGAVVQNLHIGGGGEATYLIEQPGTYFLDVSGSESWRIWLEPRNSAETN